jgi:hypothetical protein
VDQTKTTESGKTEQQEDHPSPPDETASQGRTSISHARNPIFRAKAWVLQKHDELLDVSDKKFRWYSTLSRRYRKNSVAGLIGILFVVVTSVCGAFSITPEKIVKWLSGPRPTFDGQATFSIASSGNSASVFDLTYKLVVTLSNSGDELKGDGALLILSADNGTFIPVAADSDQPILNKPGLTTSWPYNVRVKAENLPNICSHAFGNLQRTAACPSCFIWHIMK